jgi:hypothetical protein
MALIGSKIRAYPKTQWILIIFQFLDAQKYGGFQKIVGVPQNNPNHACPLKY